MLALRIANLQAPLHALKFLRSSTALSAGGCRQQFSIPENTRLSMFGAKFLRSAAEHLTVSGDEPADVSWRERGYLLLASQAGEESMRKNYLSQVLYMY